MVSLRTRFLMIVAFAAVLCGLPAQAQAQDGQLRGVVRDTTGAAVPGASVTVTNQATNATQTVTSGADGSFSASLAPGTYSVTVALRGFGRQTKRDLKVDASAPAAVEFSLEPQLQEEVTVTAMRREQTLEEVPFSVAAPTEEQLQRLGVDNIEGVAANVAGFTVQNLGPGQSQVAIRGVSAGQIVRDQPGVKEQVGAYLDDSIISLSLFTPDLDLFDVGRVEVLRGPQGTLFGSGSLSGTVRYISNPPELGRQEVLRRGLGQHDQRRQPGRRRQARVQRSSRHQGRAAGGVVLHPHRRLHRRRAAGISASRRTSTAATGRACGRRSRSHQRAPDHHAAHRLPARRDGRLEPHRHLQHPGQPLHHLAAPGDPG
jgi:outer membrane receptor protein involved in Fe transport